MNKIFKVYIRLCLIIAVVYMVAVIFIYGHNDLTIEGYKNIKSIPSPFFNYSVNYSLGHNLSIKLLP